MELRGKTILLTGASSGIGLELGRLLAREKVRLALLARRENRLRRLADELKKTGSRILPLKCDVSKVSEVRRSCRKVKSRFGPVDIAILNAGLSHRSSAGQFDPELAEEVFEVNVFGVINFIGELLPDFIRRREGVIVGVSSLSDCRGFPLSGPYNASKAAVTALLESLRVELKRSHVGVVTVKPGFVRTPMSEGGRHPKPFMMSAGKAARIIVNGLKKDKPVIQFPLPTAWGSKLLKAMPDFLFEMMIGRIRM